MASSAPQCCQAVRRHLCLHYDGVWVPDSLLASAFERYVAISKTFARYGSSVPGPMEHRKRLARRHMGELHLGQSHSAAPIWELASLVDLTQWRWQAPTPPNVKKRQNVNPTEMRTLLDPSPVPLTPLSPLCADATAERRSLSEPLLPDDTVLSNVAESFLSSPWGAGRTPLDVIDTGITALSRDIVNEAGDMPHFTEFCERWRQALAEGLFHGEAIGKVLSGIADGLDVEPLRDYDPRTVDRLKLDFMEATINGFCKGDAQDTTSFDHIAWNAILHGVSTIPMNTIRLFTRAMACIPEPCIEAVSPGILDNLDVFFDALGRATDNSTVARQAAKMAEPLKALGKPALRFILDHATQMVLEYASVEGVDLRNIRFSWLHLLVRFPGVDIDYLSQTCIALEASSAFGPLKESEICKLFLVWANKQAPLEQYAQLRAALRHRTYCHDPLGKVLWETRQFHRVRQFAELLHAIGRESSIKWLVKGVIIPFRRGPRNLANMALGISKPQVAIDIICLYEESQRRRKRFWESEFGFKALEMLTWTPNFDHKKYWRVLKFIPRQEFKVRHYRRRVRTLQSGRISMIAAIAIVVALSPHIGRRASFAFITQCYVYLRRRFAKLRAPFLRALVRNVTAQLKDNQPVTISRLRYVLFIIQREMGKAHAQSVASVLWQWHVRHRQQRDRLRNDRL
ncbi:hypothetical protein F4861DRAFT_243934 [Xylaria intraflava]|nr:hypothetical protein F4861DRAFT_243934 [Xylaria intraflava]